MKYPTLSELFTRIAIAVGVYIVLFGGIYFLVYLETM